MASEARLTGRNVSVNRVRFRTRDQGRIELIGVDKQGPVELREEGGPARIVPKSLPQAAK